MKYLLLIASLAASGEPTISVVEFDSMVACEAEKKDISLWLKMQKLSAISHITCLTKAEGPKPNAK